jgi:hypothetical protein
MRKIVVSHSLTPNSHLVLSVTNAHYPLERTHIYINIYVGEYFTPDKGNRQRSSVLSEKLSEFIKQIFEFFSLQKYS